MIFTADDAQKLHQIMQWRRDVRQFRPDPVAPDLIDKLAAAMDLAPSVGNCRPWRVIRVQDQGRRQRIADLFAASNAVAAAAYPDADRDAYLGLKLAGLQEAPEHLAVFSVPEPPEGRGLGRQTMPETVVYSTVMAMYALWLVARAENLGVGWVSILDPLAAAAALDPPPEWQFVGYLCLGYAEFADDTPLLHRSGWQANTAQPWLDR